MRTFDIYVGSIFIYNYETWTVTNSCENRTDSFQRRLATTNIHTKHEMA